MSKKPRSSEPRTYTEEEVQAKIDEAQAGHFYWNVDDFPNKTNVIGGASKQWSAGVDIVYAPDARFCGSKSAVLAAFDTYDIDEDSRTLYEDAKSEGFKDELDRYKEQRKTPALADKDTFDKLSTAIRRGGKQKEEESLTTTIKSLLPGRVVNVTEKKHSTIAAPPAHVLSNFICVPGLSIASKTEEEYAAAARSVLEGELLDAYIDAWRALKRVRDLRRPAKQEKKPEGAPKANGKADPKKEVKSESKSEAKSDAKVPKKTTSAAAKSTGAAAKASTPVKKTSAKK